VMSVRDAALAALTSIICGLAFPAIKFGLVSFSAPELTVIRFLIASLPVLVVRRPKLSWTSITVIGLTLFTGQFLFLFFAYTRGLPPGLASLTQQMQAFFTVLLAAVFLRDLPTRGQVLGMVVALSGLVIIGGTVGADLTVPGLSLGLAGAFSWAVGNVLMKQTAGVPVFPLVVWCSVIPPLPAAAVSAVVDGHVSVSAVLGHASWISIAAVVYLGTMATTVAYAIWGYLLRRYPAATIAPFAMIAPCTGIVASAIIFGEVFAPARYAGMALTLAGLAVTLRPRGWGDRDSAGR
jgi:O-acetylserine/cysteine efflux transporter